MFVPVDRCLVLRTEHVLCHDQLHVLKGAILSGTFHHINAYMKQLLIAEQLLIANVATTEANMVFLPCAN